MEILNCFGNLEHYGICYPEDGRVSGNACLHQEGDISYITLTMDCVEYPYDYCRVFCRERAAGVVLEVGHIDQMMAQHCVSPFWAKPLFAENAMGKELQFVLLQSGGKYLFVLPLVNDKFTAGAMVTDGRLEVHADLLRAGVLSVSGTVAVIAEADEPYGAIRKGFRAAWEKGLVKTPPKAQKEYPAILNKLGWCTWNAFYHNVTEDKLLAKLEEFKQKAIPVKWVLIDDGWSEVDNMKLLSVYEDRTKFPNGLKHTINRMKAEYGIEKVGVWHSLTGYWFGLEKPDSDTVTGCTGRHIPAGYDFYSKWHRYLKHQGVDFVKVDCQGNAAEFLMNTPAAPKNVASIMDGLEKSAAENFDFMINCMGMRSINALQHTNSVLLRSSDDFFPNQQDAFRNHVQSNVYNAVFMDELFYCDYDMWWSEHFDGKRNAVLRYFSGGPVYLSDELHKSSPEFVRLFAAEDGSFPRPDSALKPTYDCLFGYQNLLKAFTHIGDTYIVAAFTFEDACTVSLSAGDFGGIGKYRVSSVFRKICVEVEAGGTFQVPLCAHEVEVFYFRPCAERGSDGIDFLTH